MTFILNVLHRDMSILAADQKAIEGFTNGGSPTISVQDEVGSIVHDYEKITLHFGNDLALGVAGNTQDHYYLPTIDFSVGIDDALWKIRKHLEGFLRIHDRTSLKTLTSFTVNQGVASFFDQVTDTYCTNTFLFSPVEIQNRLHRGRDEVQILIAGSGSEHFKNVVSTEDINAFKGAVNTSCTPEACVSWVQDVYRRVSVQDSGTGSEAVLFASTRSNPKFRKI